MDWFALLIGVSFFGLGLFIARAPVEELLQWDRRTARALYDSATSHELGLARAGAFYRFFGGTIAVLGPCFAAGYTLLATSG